MFIKDGISIKTWLFLVKLSSKFDLIYASTRCHYKIHPRASAIHVHRNLFQLILITQIFIRSFSQNDIGLFRSVWPNLQAHNGYCTYCQTFCMPIHAVQAQFNIWTDIYLGIESISKENIRCGLVTSRTAGDRCIEYRLARGGNAAGRSASFAETRTSSCAGSSEVAESRRYSCVH